MNKPTMQELFNTAFLGVWNQGRKSENKDGGCQYRGPDGLKCAAGHIIPDDLYQEAMEGGSFCMNWEFSPVIKHLDIDNDGIKMIYEMQVAHDARNNLSVESFRLDWEHECARIATRFGLKMPDLPGHEPCDTQASS